jgi:bacterioferritin (cytochrome b1)
MIQTVIDLLTEARLSELEAIGQSMVHHDELENNDLGQLAAQIKEIAVAKMKQAEKLAERILVLKGEPLSKTNATTKRGQKIPEMLATDMVLRQALEVTRIKIYSGVVERPSHPLELPPQGDWKLSAKPKEDQSEDTR